MIAGDSKCCILTGKNLQSYRNLFVLVHLSSLEVANKENPVVLEWTGIGILLV